MEWKKVSPRLLRAAPLRAALICLGLLLLEGHVTIVPGEVVAGASTRFVVRVPTERPVATIRLRLEFPEGLGAPRFLAKSGWTYVLEKEPSGKVTAVTWSGGRIAPDEYDEFVFTARAPAPGTLVFRAYQTYESGEIVAWDQPEGDEGPAPRVVVQDSAAARAAGAAEQSAAGDPTLAVWLGGAALVISLIALAAGLGRRGR